MERGDCGGTAQARGPQQPEPARPPSTQLDLPNSKLVSRAAPAGDEGCCAGADEMHFDLAFGETWPPHVPEREEPAGPPWNEGHVCGSGVVADLVFRRARTACGSPSDGGASGGKYRGSAPPRRCDTGSSPTIWPQGQPMKPRRVKQQ